MKPLFKYFGFTANLLIVFLLMSCGTVPVPPVKVSPAEVVDVILVDPYSEIQLVEKKETMIYNDSLSNLSSQLIKEAILAHSNWIPVTDTMSINDEKTFDSYKTFMLNMSATRSENRYAVPIPTALDSLIESTGHRFGMIVWATGYERSKKNYIVNEILSVVTALATAVITMGTYYYYPMAYKGSLSLNVAIIDSRDDLVAYQNNLKVQDKKPTDYSLISKQVKNLFSSYFIYSGDEK